MKRLIFKALMVVVIMFGLANYAGYLMTGQVPELPSLSTSHLKMPDVKAWLPDGKPSILQGDEESSAKPIYKWEDADGVWHFSSDLPPAGVVYETVVVDGDVNIVSAPESQGARKSAQSSKKTEKAAAGINAPNPYSVDGVQDMLKKSKNVQQQIDQRAEQQAEILEKL